MTTENQTQWQLVPVEPTEEMLKVEVSPMLCVGRPENLRVAQWRVGVYKAMLAAAPQPPALGGEPEVIYMLRNTALNTPWRDADKAAFDCAAGLVEYERRELVDRAHVARLQAEVERQSAERQTYFESTLRACRIIGQQLAVLRELKPDAALAGGKEHE